MNCIFTVSNKLGKKKKMFGKSWLLWDFWVVLLFLILKINKKKKRIEICSKQDIRNAHEKKKEETKTIIRIRI